jgi:hypothetical protein
LLVVAVVVHPTVVEAVVPVDIEHQLELQVATLLQKILLSLLQRLTTPLQLVLAEVYQQTVQIQYLELLHRLAVDEVAQVVQLALAQVVLVEE